MALSYVATSTKNDVGYMTNTGLKIIQWGIR
jgi:hypothetical protein